MPMILEPQDWPTWLGEIAGDHIALLCAFEVAGFRFIAPFDRPSSWLPIPSGPGLFALPMQTGSLHSRGQRLGKSMEAATVHGIARASADGPFSDVA
jgi:hypothetical protein